MPMYIVRTTASTLTAATAKSLVGLIGASTRRFKLKTVEASFSSVTATDAPVLIEICRGDQSTAGTTTAQTPTKEDPAETAAITTGAVNYTAEPTVLTVVKGWYVSPIGGTFLWEIPNMREIWFALSTSCFLRFTSPATLAGVGAALTYEE